MDLVPGVVTAAMTLPGSPSTATTMTSTTYLPSPSLTAAPSPFAFGYPPLGSYIVEDTPLRLVIIILLFIWRSSSNRAEKVQKELNDAKAACTKINEELVVEKATGQARVEELRQGAASLERRFDGDWQRIIERVTQVERVTNRQENYEIVSLTREVEKLKKEMISSET